VKARIAALFLIVCVSLGIAADDRLTGIPELIHAQKGGIARERLLAARAAYQVEKDIKGEARALILLAFANTILREDAAARETMEQAATLLVAADEPFGAWMALFFLAGVDTERQHWDEAVKHHLAALEMLKSVNARPASLQTMADLAPLFGHSRELFDMLLNILPPGAGGMLVSLFEMMNRDALAGVYIERGELERAESELDLAAGHSSRFFGMFDAPIAAHRGDIARRRWKFDEARSYYRKAIEGTSMLPLPRTLSEWTELSIMGQLEDIELLSGDLEAALAWNDKALRFVRDRRQHTREASILQNRAALLMQAGRIPDALAILTQAESIAESESVSLQASVLTDIGSMQMFKGDYGLAAATLEKAIALYPFANNIRGETQAWMMLTEVYLSLAAFDDAGVFLEKACALATRSDYPPALALADAVTSMRTIMTVPAEPASVVNAFDAMRTVAEQLGVDATAIPGLLHTKTLLDASQRFRDGETDEARQLFLKLLGVSFNRDIRAGALAGLGGIYLNEKKMPEAIACLREAADLVEETIPGIQDDALMARYLGADRHVYFELTVELMLREGLIDEAFDYTERARARAFLRTIGNHRVAAPRGADVDLVREAEALRTRINEWNRSGAPIAGDLENARKRYATLITRLRNTTPEYASLTHIEPLRADAIRAELPADTTLISYFITTKGAHAFVVDRTGIDHVKLPLDTAAMQRAVCWAKEFQPPRTRGAKPRALHCPDRATPSEVYERLVAPLRSSIRNRRLIIVPHNALHYIPFAALYDAERKQYLVETHTLTFIPSASALRFLKTKESPVTGRAVVLGDPESRTGELPGAKTEAMVIARDLRTKPFLGSEATESALFALAASTDLVHIGAHAEFDSMNPLFSRIELAAGNGRDGFLEVHEILGELDLTGVNLVVLSACETAIGERSGGDDVVGLTRAILYAGSPGVISTLWKINDDAAAVLMQEFYRRFTRGATAADALREAQLSLLRNETFADPKNWAAFTLTGHPTARWSH
jgi:CHAT domain-containing protein/tetratricopeptide (TPR) repeat protein